MKFLPRATSSVTFQNPPIFSPAKDKRSSEKTHKSHLGIGFSGPMVSMIPAETRRKIKNDKDYTVVYEPTSPRVSCMGQVKCKYQKEKLHRHHRHGHGGSGDNKPPSTTVKPIDKTSRITSFTVERTHSVDYDHEEALKKERKSKKKLGFKKIFGGGGTSGGGGRNLWWWWWWYYCICATCMFEMSNFVCIICICATTHRAYVYKCYG